MVILMRDRLDHLQAGRHKVVLLVLCPMMTFNCISCFNVICLLIVQDSILPYSVVSIRSIDPVGSLDRIFLMHSQAGSLESHCCSLP